MFGWWCARQLSKLAGIHCASLPGHNVVQHTPLAKGLGGFMSLNQAGQAITDSGGSLARICFIISGLDFSVSEMDPNVRAYLMPQVAA